MQYLSTRGGIAPVSFKDSVMMGLATDGGLLLPDRLPHVAGQLDAWARLSYPELAEEILALFATDLPRAELRRLVRASYATFSHPEVAPVVPVGPLYVQELFHGPTLAFKDLALQLLGRLFEYILAERDERLNILAATSGDTGSAAIAGVRGMERIRIFVLHPHQRVSPIQERQMTTVLDANVHNLALQGSFDDCQRIIKDLFGDLPFKDRYRLGAVNSVNLARVLIQVVYYFYAALRVRALSGAERVQFAVPTGNFGNVFAGWLAWRLGAPIARLVLATNENDILARFFQSGVYAQGDVHLTLSPSMDIQVASNFERYLYYALGQDGARVRAAMQDFARQGRIDLNAPGAPYRDVQLVAGAGDTAATLRTIATYYRQYHYLLDPHTAVGVAVAERHALPGVPTVCLATAHPAKFGAAIERALGDASLARHPALDRLLELPTRVQVLPNDRRAVQDYVARVLA